MRTPIYAAHPIETRPIAPHDRFIKHIDMGERLFSFRITTEKDIAREAQAYNEAPQLLSFFPSGEGAKKESIFVIDHPSVILSSCKKEEDKYELNLFNASDVAVDAKLAIRMQNRVEEIHFEKYELLTLTIS